MKHRRITLNVPASITPDMLAKLRAILEGPAQAEEQTKAQPGEWMPGSMAQVGMEARILPGAELVNGDNVGDTFIIYERLSGEFFAEGCYLPQEIEVRWPVAVHPETPAEAEPVWRQITPEDVARIGPGDKLKIVKDIYLPAVSISQSEIVKVFENDHTAVPFHVKKDDGKTAWISILQALTCLPPAQKPGPEPEPTPVEREFVWRKVEAQDVAKVKIGDHLRLENETFGHDVGEIVTVSLTDSYGDGWPFRVAEIDLASMPYSMFSRKVFGSWQALTAENIARVKVGDLVRVDGEHESATVTAIRNGEIQAIKDAKDNQWPCFAYFDDRSRQVRFFIPDGDNE